jgi:hypothetical protein
MAALNSERDGGVSEFFLKDVHLLTLAALKWDWQSETLPSRDLQEAAYGFWDSIGHGQ